MTQKMLVSKQGIDVLGTGNTDPNNLIFDSSLNTFKILSTGTIVGTVTGDGYQLSVAHGQSGAVSFAAFCKMTDNFILTIGEKQHDDPDNRNWYATVDSTNIYFTFYAGASGNYPVTVRYYIFETPVG